MSTTPPGPVAGTVHLVPADAAFRGKQGLDYVAGISAQTTGARGICMHLLRLPPLAVPHLRGTAEHVDRRLEEHLVVPAGHFLFIPAGMPHLPYNPYPEETVAVLARTDPNEQESVVLLPELDREPGPARAT